MEPKDLTGIRFGRLIAKERTRYKNKESGWICICDCGNEHIVSTKCLTGGRVRSCGCLARDMNPSKTHGESRTRLYGIWASMKYRCKRKSGKDYYRYTLRGIRVCDEWQAFEPFKEWAIANGYTDDLTIDRIDNDKGYSPDNCRWATHKQQGLNKRTTKYITIGNETLTAVEWSERTGIAYATILWRLKKGWTPYDAVHKPLCEEKVPKKYRKDA